VIGIVIVTMVMVNVDGEERVYLPQKIRKKTYKIIANEEQYYQYSS